MSISSDGRYRLTALTSFGTDPGSLSAATYIPKSFPKKGPLVVVLHGSTQSAESYDYGSGWSALADECGVRAPVSGAKTEQQPYWQFQLVRA